MMYGIHKSKAIYIQGALLMWREIEKEDSIVHSKRNKFYHEIGSPQSTH